MGFWHPLIGSAMKVARRDPQAPKGGLAAGSPHTVCKKGWPPTVTLVPADHDLPDLHGCGPTHRLQCVLPCAMAVRLACARLLRTRLALPALQAQRPAVKGLRCAAGPDGGRAGALVAAAILLGSGVVCAEGRQSTSSGPKDSSFAEPGLFGDFIQNLSSDELRVKVLYAQAVLKEAEGSLDRAEALYRWALVYMPGHTRCHVRLAALLERTGRKEEARSTLEACAELNHSQPQPELARHLWLEAGDLQAADKMFREMAQNAKGLGPLTAAGEYLWKGAGDLDAAMDTYRKISFRYPNSIEALFAVATFLHQGANEPAVAQQYFMRGLRGLEVLVGDMEQRRVKGPRRISQDPRDMCKDYAAFVQATIPDKAAAATAINHCNDLAGRYWAVLGWLEGVVVARYRTHILEWQLKGAAASGISLPPPLPYTYDD